MSVGEKEDAQTTTWSYLPSKQRPAMAAGTERSLTLQSRLEKAQKTKAKRRNEQPARLSHNSST
jgi:hypothetical protein